MALRRESGMAKQHRQCRRTRRNEVYNNCFSHTVNFTTTNTTLYFQNSVVQKNKKERGMQQNFFHTLRTLQRQTRCTSKTLLTIIKALRPFLSFECDVPSTFRGIDNGLKRETKAIALQLNGCVKCHKHVFLPSDKDTRCPRCRFPRLSLIHI